MKNTNSNIALIKRNVELVYTNTKYFIFNTINNPVKSNIMI